MKPNSPKNTETNTHKGGGLRLPPQRGAGAEGARPPLWFPLRVLVFVYFGLLGYISVLLGHLLTVLPYQLSKQIVYLRASGGAGGRPGGRAATAATTTQDHGLHGQVPSPHAHRSNISRSGVPFTPISPSSACARGVLTCLLSN